MGAPRGRAWAAAGVVVALLAAVSWLATAGGGGLAVPAGDPDGPGARRGGPVDGSAAGGGLLAASARRLMADNVADRYSLTELIPGATPWGGTCPGSLALDRPVIVPRTEPEDQVRFPATSITRDGTGCEGGSLLVIRTLMLFNEEYMAGHDRRDAILLFNGTSWMRNWLEWSDSVGIHVDSWSCGNIPWWDNRTVMLFGDQQWGVHEVAGGVNREILRMEKGRPHMVITNGDDVFCVLSGPYRRLTSPTPPNRDTATADEATARSGRAAAGLTAGPVAAIAVGAAVAAVVAAAAAHTPAPAPPWCTSPCPAQTRPQSAPRPAPG